MRFHASRLGLIVIAAALQIAPSGAQQVPAGPNVRVELRREWGRIFDAHDAEGTVVVLDERVSGRPAWVHNAPRAERRFSPASTFKIAHALLALDAGLVRDEFQVFPWNGVKHTFEGHNQNQTLRSAMRTSALWVFQGFAAAIGHERARGYLTKIGYGNADPSVEKGDYWVDGRLAITAHEQVAFLRRLYRNELPFRVEHQRLVKDVMIVEAGREWILRGKTGWQGPMGWWVGWVEWPAGPVFFALNLDTPGGMADLPKREAITRAVLRSTDALP